MTTRHPLVLVLLTMSLLAAPVRADVSEFTSYDECILESLKGVSSDVAANAIIASCRSKFPASTPGAVVPAEPAAAPEPQSAPQPESAGQAAAATAAKPAPGPSRPLTDEELGKLKSTLFGFTTKYAITFENLNENIAITEVTIAVWDDFDPRGLKTYTETMHILPSGSAKVTYAVVYMGDDQGWRWKVESAKGVPVIN